MVFKTVLQNPMLLIVTSCMLCSLLGGLTNLCPSEQRKMCADAAGMVNCFICLGVCLILMFPSLVKNVNVKVNAKKN